MRDEAAPANDPGCVNEKSRVQTAPRAVTNRRQRRSDPAADSAGAAEASAEPLDSMNSTGCALWFSARTTASSGAISTNALVDSDLCVSDPIVLPFLGCGAIILCGPMVSTSAITAPAGTWEGRAIHFVGVGGCGMSGLALIASRLGASISGSDRSEGPFLARLRGREIPISVGHAATNVPAGAELVYSSAVPADNPERERGRELGLAELSRGDLLAEIAAMRRCIAVSGTHGKTTTAAMTVHALRGAGHRVGYVIGSDLLATGTNADWGDDEWLVVETDESDRSLLALKPEVAVLTNVELEHVHTYPSRLELGAVFRRFLAQSRHAVIWDRPELLGLRDGPAVAFDAPEPELSPAGSRFQWRGLPVTLRVPGEHNALNAAAALEASVLAGADPAAAVTALADFPGTRRRLEQIGKTASGATLYDDYAHHPTAVRASLAAARTLEPDRLIAVLQPYSHARVRMMARAFGQALALADAIVVLEVVSGSRDNGPSASGLAIARAAAETGGARSVAWMPDPIAAERYLRGHLHEKDQCVLMGAGEIAELAHHLLA